MKFDVVVAGGSIAGLLCAREIAKNGNTVLIVEEDHEIGTPEHCGGLVSLSGLEQLGVIPNRKVYNHLVQTAEIFAPNGKSFQINSKKQKVAEISRRELDKQIAHQAQKNGAEIRVKTRFNGVSNNQAKINDEEIDCKLIVDARGVSSLINKDRDGILSCAQYEIYADWIKKGVVQVFFDNLKFPGFFAWIIPSSDGSGKVGVAGRKINAMKSLETFLADKGNYSVIRKIFAPIWIKGPIENFVSKNIIVVGDAAGQSKPTTAGGIYSSGMGGIIAGRKISKYLKDGNPKTLEEYQKEWNEKFGKEFEKQLFARKILERLDNSAINNLFELVTPEITKEISEKDDFDFHTGSIVKLLGLKGSLKTAQTIVGSEIKKLLS